MCVRVLVCVCSSQKRAAGGPDGGSDGRHSLDGFGLELESERLLGPGGTTGRWLGAHTPWPQPPPRRRGRRRLMLQRRCNGQRASSPCSALRSCGAPGSESWPGIVWRGAGGRAGGRPSRPSSASPRGSSLRSALCHGVCESRAARLIFIRTSQSRPLRRSRQHSSGGPDLVPPSGAGRLNF